MSIAPLPDLSPLSRVTPQDPIADAKRLKSIAMGMTYNDSQQEAAAKHVINEIAMRLETGAYARAE